MSAIRYLCVVVLALSITLAKATANDSEIVLNIRCVYGEHQIDLTRGPFQANDELQTQIDALRFYLSSIHLLRNDSIVYQEPNSFHLVDASVPGSMRILLDKPRTRGGNSGEAPFNAIQFSVGIDSATNVGGAMAGELDPTRGMYWTWQSGYINVKLEGRSKKSTAAAHDFQLHLGGYAEPNNSLQIVMIRTKEVNNVTIVLDVKKFIDAVNMDKNHHVMSPSTVAVMLSKFFADAFSVKSQ